MKRNGEYIKWLFYELWELIDKYGIDKVREAAKKMEEARNIPKDIFIKSK